MSPTTRKTDYTNAAQQRVLRLVNLLAGHELAGLAPSEMARALSCSASDVTRDTDNLRTAGWAEQTPGGNWRLSPHVVQMSIRHAAALNQARKTFEDTVQRFSRS